MPPGTVIPNVTNTANSGPHLQMNYPMMREKYHMVDLALDVKYYNESSFLDCDDIVMFNNWDDLGHELSNDFN